MVVSGEDSGGKQKITMADPHQGSPSSPTRKDEKQQGVSPPATSTASNNINTTTNNNSSTVPPYPPPPPPSAHHLHYYHPYPPPPPPGYDHSRPTSGGGGETAPSSTRVPPPPPPPGPYTAAQYEMRKPPGPPLPMSRYSAGGGPAPVSSGPPLPPGKSPTGSSPKSTPPSTSSSNGAGRDPPPTHPYHHPGVHGEHGAPPPPPPPHHHHPAYPYRDEHHRGPPPPPHHHRPWGDYAPHSHFYDPPSGGTPHSYPPPPPGGYRGGGGNNRQPPPPPPAPAAPKTEASGPAAASSSSSKATKTPSPPGLLGPYRYSDTTLRREALTHLKVGVKPGDGGSVEGSSPGSEEGRDGATSPSQIELSHREEVTTMGCTCKKTKCLKLYCQCFAVKIYCGSNCRCNICQNTAECEDERQEAIRNILSRNPQAFDTKFKKTIPDKAATELSHKLGCKCRKSACMKKYCECYAGSVRCSENCRCVGCKNVAGRPGGPPYPPHGVPMMTGMPQPISSHHHLGPSLLVAAIAAQPGDHESGANTARKREPYMMNAAHNLAFLKHASPAADKSGGAPKRTPSQDGDMGSMPSLASSEDSPNDSTKAEDVPLQKLKSVASAAATTTLEPNTAEKTAVNALLMAAVAMTEMSGQATSKTEVPLVSTPPDARLHDTSAPMEEDDCKTPQKNLLRQFQSPKRKQADDRESPGEHKEKDSATPKIISHGKIRSQTPSGGSSNESSPNSATGEEDNDDSPKRDNSELTDMTPSLQQKSKRSRVGSVRKGPSRNLGQEMAQGQPSPMVMQTPKQAKNVLTTDLTPVSARCIDFKRMNVGKGSPDQAGH